MTVSKTLNIKVCLTASLLLLVFAVGCKKQVAGPKGDPGAPAPQGNVKQFQGANYYMDSTEWVTNGTVWESVIYIPEINLNTAEVKVFKKIGTEWWALPYTEGEVFTQFSYNDILVRLTCYELHGPPGLRPAPAYYRVVVLDKVN